MGSTPEKGPMELGPAPLNFIYSCSLCSATFADVYEGHNQSVRGLSDGINPKDRLVTRLFLASCCHVFCSSHLEGGGPPFHSDKERPKAPCPVCIKEKGDSEPQFLYSIRGFNKNEYDPMIPPSWFTAPPIRLDGNGKEMDALRFQYIALIRYCQNTYATRKPLEQTLKESEKKLANMRNLVSEEHAKMISLQKETDKLKAQKDQFEAMQAEVQRLQGVEQEFEQLRSLNVNARDLKTFITNKSAIRHYLKLVPMLMEQNEKMQKRLAQLGFAMPVQPIPNFRGVDPSAFDSDETLVRDDHRDFNEVLRKATSSHTVSGYAHASDKVRTTPSSSYLRRPGKRQRLDSPLPKDMQVDCSPGRQPMPPPAKPLLRMQSMRNIFPTLRKKFAGDRSSPLADKNLGVGRGIQMYKDANWQSANTTRQEARNELHSEPPCMSGALPMGQHSQHLGSRNPQPNANVSIHEHQSDFTFQASSPAKAESCSKRYRPVQLPIEPSYIRLMDGLSCGDEVELGLRDPRDNAGLDYQGDSSNRQVEHAYENQPVSQTTYRKTPWSPGNIYTHSIPYGLSASVETYQRPPQSRPTNVSTNRLYNGPNIGRAQPSPKRYHHPGNSIENVVSPYFRDSHSQAQIYSPSGLAEPDGSSNHSDVYRSQRSTMAKSQATWLEPRGLNGLSFFDSPVSPRNESGGLTRSYNRTDLDPNIPSRYRQTRHIDSKRLITRPETEWPQYSNNGVYVSSENQPSYVRQPTGYVRTVPSPSSQKSPTHNRSGKVLSSMPSFISGHFSGRSQLQWKNLQRAGVRSSQNVFASSSQNILGPLSKNMPSVSRRRNIVR